MKKPLRWLLVLLVLGGVAWGSWSYFRSLSRTPTTPAQAKAVIDRYLDKKRGSRKTTVPADIASEKKPWHILAPAYDTPLDYEMVYSAMQAHLKVADTLLASADEKSRTAGLRIILELADVANEVAADPWLGARLADAYLLPAIAAAHDNARETYPREQLMELAGDYYKQAEDNDHLILLGRDYLAHYPDRPQADRVRREVARLLQGRGEKEEANKIMADIKNPELRKRFGLPPLPAKAAN